MIKKLILFLNTFGIIVIEMRLMIYIVYSPEKEILEHEVSKIIKYEDVINFDYNEVEHEYIISEILAIDLFVEKKCFIINNSKFLTNKSSSIKDNTLKSMFNSFSTILTQISG